MKNLNQWIISIVLVGLVVSCAKKPKEDESSDGAAVLPSDPLPEASQTTSLDCKSSVIDTGQKGSVAAVARGAYSDTKITPGTSSPVTAFVDASALSIKLAYWNGSNFSTEVIAADGAATFVRLAFLSNKTPIVFWALGGNLKAAIRTSPLGNSGTWRADVIDTGVAPRAIEVSVNPLDQVAVTFLTDTAVTGRAKFLYCDSPCSSPAGFQTMNTNAYIENTNLIAAQVATGSAWCQASSTTFYPVASYSVTGNTKFAICKNTLANCLNGANWITQSVVATGSVSSKVYLDSSVVGDVPKVMALGASGLVPYRMGTTLCTGTLGAFTAGAAMGTATVGNQWMSLMKDGVGKFHVLANDTTTSVKYYNSTGTDLIGSWNAVGTADTVALPAAQGGGAALDTASLGIYASYGINAVPYDIKLVRVNDYTKTASTATYTRFTPDLTGNIQLPTAGSQQKQISVASTSIGKPGVAYLDFSIGAAAGAKLKYAYRSQDGASTAWEWVVVPGTINPQFPSLIYDSNNIPWISYFDASTNRFYLTTNSSVDGSGNWFTYEFPVTPSGAPIAMPAANNTALGVYKHNGQSDIAMVVIDTNATSKGVKVAIFNTSSRSFQAGVVIDGLTAGALGAAHLSVDADVSGSLAVAYQDLNVTKVKYASSADGGATWTTPLSISGLAQGPGVQLRVNPSTGSPSVAYYGQAFNTVYYSTCAGNLASCATGGWSPVVIESAAGVSGLAANSGQLLSASLQFAYGKAFVFYPRGQSNDGSLIVASNASGIFSSAIVASGINASLPGAPALNFGVSGWGVQMAPNAVGSFSGAYLGPGNWLYSISCGD